VTSVRIAGSTSFAAGIDGAGRIFMVSFPNETR
jgi:hypothetical protein